MPISGWVTFLILACLVVFAGEIIMLIIHDIITLNDAGVFVWRLLILVVVAIMFLGMHLYYQNTASGRRQVVDEKINLSNGIERTINVYTADGQIMATYHGKIDIEASQGGYIKFDYEGKRYIYYNCFVETIAEIE